MAQVRLETYQEFATPQPLGRLYKSVGIPFVSALTLIFFLCMLAVVWYKGTDLFAGYQGNFYAIFPHNFCTIVWSDLYSCNCSVFGIGISKFWRQTSKVIHGKVEKPDLVQATQTY